MQRKTAIAKKRSQVNALNYKSQKTNLPHLATTRLKLMMGNIHPLGFNKP
jgi:hypothetical protein